MNTRLTAALAAAALAFPGSAAFAAEDFREPGAVRSHASAFAGASFRIALGSRTPARAQARLHAGFRHRNGADMSSFDGRGTFLTGLSLGGGRHGKPALYMGGTEMGQLKDRLGVSTGGAIAIGAGVTLLALVALAASSDKPDIGCAVVPEDC